MFIETLRKTVFILSGFVVMLPVGISAQAIEEAETRGSVVEVRADLSDISPRVTLRWNAGHFPSTGITVYRRGRGSSDWGTGTTLASSAVSFSDITALSGVGYEYRVVRTQNSDFTPVVEGYLWSGVKIPAADQRGRLILIVDDSMSTPLATEVNRLIADLSGDGWFVVRSDVARTATVAQVRATIKARYDESPGNSRAVFLLGRVPVPYSGIVCPDGHYDPPPDAHHRGAWPADVFYGDMDGVWTDATVNHSIANVDGTRNHNIPGDGKFDQSLISGDHLPEMVVGRVDLANMSGVSNGVSETELLRRYLNRHHAFRHRLAPFETLGERALVDNNFGFFDGLGFAASGWASGISLFGNSNTTAVVDWVTTLRDNDYLVAYGCGPGSLESAGGVSMISDFRDTRCRAVVNMLFGSFFGDWDSANNYLRAPLVGTSDSHGLVSFWAGNPRWQLFPLAAGGTIADAYRHVVFEVNQPAGPFPPVDASWTNPDQSHVAIMGDPVLRLQPVKPVTGLIAAVSGNSITLTWVNPVGEANLLGCHIYRATSASGPFTRLGGRTAVGVTSVVDAVSGTGSFFYMVRAVKLQTTASASYENPAQGIVVPAVMSFGAWVAGLGDVTETGDPNRDGISNLVAYAVGASNGNTRAFNQLPRVNSDGSFTLTQSERGDVNYSLQLSTDLTTWYSVATKPAGGSWSVNAASGYPNQGNVILSGTTAKTVVDSTPASKRFWRLAVSL